MWVSDWVAGWPGAGLRLPLIDSTAAVALALAAAFLVLPITRLRLLAVPLLVVAVGLLWRGPDRPLLLVDERAATVALLTDTGLVPAQGKYGAASVSRWLAQAGDTAGFKQAAKRSGWTCNGDVCEAKEGVVRVAFLQKHVGLVQRCPQVDVLVSQDPLRRRCRGKLVTVDRFDVWRNGAYAVYANGRLEHVRGIQGVRPWVYEPRARTKP